MENKCSRRPQCANSNSSDDLRWVQTTDRCLTVDIASAVSISGEETAYPRETSSIVSWKRQGWHWTVLCTYICNLSAFTEEDIVLTPFHTVSANPDVIWIRSRLHSHVHFRYSTILCPTCVWLISIWRLRSCWESCCCFSCAQAASGGGELGYDMHQNYRDSTTR